MKEVTKGIKDHLLSIGYPTQEKIYYLDVWLWLWREKNIRIHTRDFYGGLAVSESSTSYDSINHADPEEAIIAAIDYLVTKDLIK